MQSDIELVKLIQQGHKEAFEVLYERHKQFVFFYCKKLIKDENKVGDMFQGTFTKVLEKINTFDTKHSTVNFKGWLTKIAFRTVLDEIRKSRAHKKVRRGIIERGNTHSGKEINPQQALIQKEKQEICVKALAGLQEVTRFCIISHDIHDVPRIDLAESEGIKIYQIDYHLKVGREILIKELKIYKPVKTKKGEIVISILLFL